MSGKLPALKPRKVIKALERQLKSSWICFDLSTAYSRYLSYFNGYFFCNGVIRRWRLSILFKSFKVTENGVCGHCACLFKSITLSNQPRKCRTKNNITTCLIRGHDNCVIQDFHVFDYITHSLLLTTNFSRLLASAFCLL